MKQDPKTKRANIIFCVCLGFSIALMIGGFFTPPIGEINSSLLTAVGFLFAFSLVGQLPVLIKNRNVQIAHGETSINIEQQDTQNTEA